MDGVDTMGEPASRITTDVDVTRWIDQKRQAMRAHASQIGEASFFLSMPEDVFSDGVGAGVVHPGPTPLEPSWATAEPAGCWMLGGHRARRHRPTGAVR